MQSEPVPIERLLDKLADFEQRARAACRAAEQLGDVSLARLHRASALECSEMLALLKRQWRL